MFQQSVENISGFTRPIHIIRRTYGGLVVPGSATLFFVNDSGVAITCKHIANLIRQSDEINAAYQNFIAERQKIPQNGKYRQSLAGLELKYKYDKETTIQQKINFINCVEKPEKITCHFHPNLDLAIIEFTGYEKLLYTGHARFMDNSQKIRQGKYLCRIGFPFPEFNNFKYNPQTDDIEWTQTGTPNSPIFPIDGILTRFISNPMEGLSGIEMSTPGLRGQSGGPLFDSDGTIFGMQYATNHLHLGFDLKDKEIMENGKKMKVSNYPFLHVGLSIHVDKIKEFLQKHSIRYNQTS